ncbi:hypothetical protein MAPG_07944 [Magnaporthiopsis poae ATCC 64411]|uniref:Uncharacterized protein n=1 Tax=Magnaporthiopsis poae (strain ATCC 64411 / 73-15) TaxID=644358 RepID=A0A0C4E616_MAGP6|nr:hypothetical protein MAPG_07944 [Magnaporthiopsis poae ATCC 64411]
MDALKFSSGATQSQPKPAARLNFPPWGMLEPGARVFRDASRDREGPAQIAGESTWLAGLSGWLVGSLPEGCTGSTPAAVS